jgi:hypothetical protein
VEVRDRLVERVGGEIGQRLLELAEGHGGLVKVLGAARHVETESLGDVGIGAPVLAVLVHIVFLPVPAPERRWIDLLAQATGFAEMKRVTASMFSMSCSGRRNATRLIFCTVYSLRPSQTHVKRAVDMSRCRRVRRRTGVPSKRKLLQNLFHEKNLNLSLLIPAYAPRGGGCAGQQTYCSFFAKSQHTPFYRLSA